MHHIVLPAKYVRQLSQGFVISLHFEKLRLGEHSGPPECFTTSAMGSLEALLVSDHDVISAGWTIFTSF